MAITVAVQQGKFVKVYDERRRQLFSKFGEVYGFTSNTVSVLEGKWVKVYDEKGRSISSHFVG